MEFVFYKPKDEVLKQYIEGYYLLSRKMNFQKKYISFPNNYAILTFLKSATVEKIGDKIFINRSDENSILSLSYNYIKPWTIIYSEPVDELTIYFKPFGINQFISNIEKYFKDESVENLVAEEFSINELNQLLNTVQNENPVQLIDAFLRARFKPICDPILERTLLMLENDLSISEISKILSLSRQYVNRYFKSKIGKSLSDYRKIARFRNILNERKAHHSLTTLSYENLFFDQSHFNKDFKQLTSLKPKQFFDHTDTNSSTVWFML